jgi:FKBP-type peptidyl-prolyl cis-trans isomerase FklB
MAESKTGKAASTKFLEDNKTKEGVVVLPSGLQYKVLREGWGLDHPKAGTKCECHYAGTLIDGTEFDSSYKRGKPTAFAPNQVIKGWTEAMQLMVEGDKWEMYINSDLGYGDSGSPPKIPGGAALIFVMEIIKINGPTVAKAGIVFPEWTEEQLKLWGEKDEAAIQKWRDTRIKSYEDGNMRDVHPTREAFDAWLDKQCKSSKDKSLWKRTKKPAEAPKPAGLTKETARSLLDKALATFKQPDNKTKLEKIIKECDDAAAADPSQAGMMKMMKLLPEVQTLMGPTLSEYGFMPGDLMTVTMQIQAFAAEDASISADVAKLMKAAQGDVAALFA